MTKKLVYITKIRCEKCGNVEKVSVWWPQHKDTLELRNHGFELKCSICGNVLVKIAEKRKEIHEKGISNPLHDSEYIEISYIYVMELIGSEVVGHEMVEENL